MNIKNGFIGSAGVDCVWQLHADEGLINPDCVCFNSSCSSNGAVRCDVLPRPGSLVEKLNACAQLRRGRRIAQMADAFSSRIGRREWGRTWSTRIEAGVLAEFAAEMLDAFSGQGSAQLWLGEDGLGGKSTSGLSAGHHHMMRRVGIKSMRVDLYTGREVGNACGRGQN